jgi:t-SNARE complex subunit (syntaxin)
MTKEKEDQLRDALWEEKICGLIKLINAQFVSVNETLDAIEKHMAEQNGTVKDLVAQGINRQVVIDDFKHLEKEYYSEIKPCVQTIDKDLDLYRMIRKNPKFAATILAVIVIVIGMGVVQTVKSWRNNINNTEIIQEMNQINYKLKEVYGISPATRGGIAQPDTLEKDINKIIK